MSESMAQSVINLGTHVLGPFLITHDTPGLKDEVGAFLFTLRVGNVVLDAWMEIEVPMLTDPPGQGPALQFGTWADAGDRLVPVMLDPQGTADEGTDISVTAAGAHNNRYLMGSPTSEIAGKKPPRFLTDAAVRVRVSDDADGDGDIGFDPITDSLTVGIVRVSFLIAVSGRTT